ncbi:MAG: putative transport system permease protein [Actinomycetota bacterium]|nr:putative transport system permease protein [Actinomycetota bacterium]
MWVRADLRRRWPSWVVLGLLAGVSVGLACAGIAGARRTDVALPRYERAAHVPDALVLANDPSYDERQRAAVAALPEVETALPFLVPFALTVKDPAALDSPLLPTDPASMSTMAGVVVAGRMPDASRADEMLVNENARKRFHLPIGSTLTLEQPSDGKDVKPVQQAMRIVGITKATDKEVDSMPSSGFYAKYRDRLVGATNQFVMLRRGEADVAQLQTDVQRIVGHPINVASAQDMFGLRKLANVSNVEQGGLLLFALAVVIGAGVLVGQALVRTVTAGAADLETWRAIGADRRVAVSALVAPAALMASVGAITAMAVAIALSPRFPIALSRNFDLDIGVHADWPVLLPAAAGLAVAALATAWLTAEIRLRRFESRQPRSSAVARLTAAADLPPALLVGARLATEPGRGRRAVPVRSALIGSIVGVLGVTACLTFRNGLTEAVANPARSGLVWNAVLAAEGAPVSPTATATIARDPAVDSVLDARWERAVTINGSSVPTFGTRSIKGAIDFVMVDGRAPRGTDEIAFAPTTLHRMHVRVGDTVRVGAHGRSVRVVGTALLPATSHTDYDQSAWMTANALDAVVPPNAPAANQIEDWILVRWTPGADATAALKRFSGLDPQYFVGPVQSPTAVVSLGKLRVLPFALAIFFALLAAATVAHALVTTVRRRNRDLAILRAVGFTRRETRIAIGWQATLLAVGGLVIGVPLGILVGRAVWKQLAISFPVIYAPPLALVGVLLIVPIAIVVVNALAAGPAHVATRIRPAQALRTE